MAERRLVLKYLSSLFESTSSKNELWYWMTEHLRMSGVYWAVMSVAILENDFKSSSLAAKRSELLDFVKQCRDCETGGFAANIGFDAHLLYTLSALQICALVDGFSEVFPSREDKSKLVKYISSLQQPDGSFAGDEWGEIDTRFSYCAIQSLILLDSLDAINVEKAVSYVLSCQNFDGGFGSIKGAESHAGQIFCCVGVLAMTGCLERLGDSADKLAWWLSERQLEGSGGLNGRPEKLEDVCYSWWVFSSLKMLKRDSWIDGTRLLNFIMACQDKETGGFSDRPGNVPDPFHTLFGLASMSMLSEKEVESCGDKENNLSSCFGNLSPVNPIYCLPANLKTLKNYRQ